jgi:hypothetical protein
MSDASSAPPPPFGDPYYRARKAYGLCSGLLIGWALIGVEFNSTPIENIHVVLKSPDAVPYVLVVLTLPLLDRRDRYFGPGANIA